MIGTTEQFNRVKKVQQNSAEVAARALEYGEELETMRKDYLKKRPKTLRAKISLRNRRLEKSLLDEESSVGRNIFGALPEGHHREFFNLSPDIWIWHEEESAPDGQPASQTTRYQVDKRGVKKVRLARPNVYLKDEELENFDKATRKYFTLAKRYYEGK
ncbi:hypothetical protein FWH13_02485 [Candidatus Saccharibacteria bacterium]|nr:hypothetical protein [Candidatus Saccharibacteria bacterium]